jgi:y4mF family transcriptional regulator
MPLGFVPTLNVHPNGSIGYVWAGFKALSNTRKTNVHPIGSILVDFTSPLGYYSLGTSNLHPIGSKSIETNTENMDQDLGKKMGDFVRDRRKASGFSQQALGEMAGVGRRFVSELEMAKPTVRLDSVNKVLAVFGKTLGIVDARTDDLR